MISEEKDMNLECQRILIDHVINSFSTIIGLSLSHISSQAIIHQDATALKHLADICTELEFAEELAHIPDDNMDLEDGLRTNSHTDNCDKDVVGMVQRLMTAHECSCRLERVEDISDEVIVSLYEMVTGRELKGVHRGAVLRKDKVANVQNVVVALEECILDTSLTHICPEDIVDGDQTPLRYIVEIFQELDSYARKDKNELYKDSPRPSKSPKINEFSMENCKRVLDKYKILYVADSDDVSCSQKSENSIESCGKLQSEGCTCGKSEAMKKSECPKYETKSAPKEDQPTINGNVFDKGYLLPYLVHNYPDTYLSKSAREPLCRPMQAHKARTDMLVRRRNRRLMVNMGGAVDCENDGEILKRFCSRNVKAIAQKDCMGIKKNSLKRESEISGVCCSDGDNDDSDAEVGGECGDNGGNRGRNKSECWMEENEKRFDVEELLKKMAQPRCQKQDLEQKKMKCLLDCLKEKRNKKVEMKIKKRKKLQQAGKICCIEKYYRDQYAILVEEMAQWRKDGTQKDIQQDRLLREMKIEMRNNIENELKNIQGEL